MSSFLEQLMLDEGFRESVYDDHLGYPTIGYGTRINELVVTKAEAKSWLINELVEKDARLVTIPAFLDLSTVRQDIIRSMSYQMGVRGTKNFKDMWKAISNNDFDAAGAAMRDSRWWRDPQTKGRAEKMAVRMETGVW